MIENFKTCQKSILETNKYKKLNDKKHISCKENFNIIVKILYKLDIFSFKNIFFGLVIWKAELHENLRGTTIFLRPSQRQVMPIFFN